MGEVDILRLSKQDGFKSSDAFLRKRIATMFLICRWSSYEQLPSGFFITYLEKCELASKRGIQPM